MERVVRALIIEDKKLLFLRELTLPGGKPKRGESDKETLERKFKEDTGAKLKVGERYKTFMGLTPDEKDALEVVTYFAEREGRGKIKKSKLIGYTDRSFLGSDDIMNNIIEQLNDDGHL